MSAKKTKGGTLGHVQVQVAAIQKPGVLPTGFSMMVSGKSYDGPGVATLLTGVAAPFVAKTNAQAAAKEAEEAAKAATPELKSTSQDVDSGFKAYFGVASQTLASLDITPKTPRPPRTTAQKLQQKLKAEATRAQRGTLSPKKKASIKATSVPATSVTVDYTGVHVTAADGNSSSAAGTSSPAASGTTPTPGAS